MATRAVRLLQALKTRAGRSALACAVALIGCSSAAILYQSQDSLPADARPPQVTSTARVSSARVPIKLEDFTPLLAEPQFSSVAEAITDEEPRRAAQALEKLFTEDPSARTPTTEFWLGRLWARAGDHGRALAACQSAAKSEFELTEYAELCAARALAALGRHREVFERLRGRAFSSPGENERRLLVGRSARAAGEREHSIEALEEALEPGLPRTETARVRLDIAELLLEGVPSESDIVEALGLIRRASGVLAGIKAERARAEELERRALGRLPAEMSAKYAAPTPEERLERVTTLLDGRQNELAESAAVELLGALPKGQEFGRLGCEARLKRSKALAAMRQFSAAVDSLEEARKNCAATPSGASIWYLSAKYSASQGRYSQATDYYMELGKRFPTSSLADDGRYQAALAQQELGVESRFTELLLSLANDYPNGDMAVEGLFRVALRRMELGGWSDAQSLLERSIALVGDTDRDRGLDLSGRERYFHARALLELGNKERALSELESVVELHPLGYYMLAAYSLLERLEPGRGERVLGEARKRTEAEPFQIAGQSQLETPGFSRMMELLRIGELDMAVHELDALGLRGKGTGSEILWGVAMLYERAGFAKFSADLARRRMNEVVRRWPVAGWERAWQMAFPRPHLDLVIREARATNVDLALVYAIMREESAFDPEVVSPANAYGLMQLIEPTARRMAKSTSLPSSPQALKRPRVNVALGCRMLSHLASGFEENPLLVIPAYNAGPGRARRWIRERPSADFDLWVELIPYRETRRYTKRVLSSRAVYAYLYEPAAARSRILLPSSAVVAPLQEQAQN